jgi:putative addiction module component (TIGR02574 family)
MSMSLEQILKEAEALPAQERWSLANYLMSQLDNDPAWHPLPEEYFDELDRRLEAYRRDPASASSWEDVKARILSGNGAA